MALSFLLCRLQGQIMLSFRTLHCLLTESDTHTMYCPGWWSRVMVGLQDMGDLQGFRATQCSYAPLALKSQSQQQRFVLPPAAGLPI